METIRMGLLEGFKVVDFTTYIAGSCCSRVLAEWKAEVIKIEPLHGEPFRIWGRTLGAPILPEENPMFEVGNANKKGIALNVKTVEGQAILHRLLSEADVFVSNYRVQALENLGLTYEELHEKYPRLIYAFLNGYGSKGELAFDPGFDVISFWARGGLLGYLGEPDAPPVAALPAGGDVITGTYLAGGIMAALYGRERSGKGQKVETSLYNGAIWSSGLHLASSNYHEDRKSTRRSPCSPFENSYRSADGHWFVLSVTDHDKWPALCGLIGLPDLIIDERSDELTTMLDRAFGLMKMSEIEACLSKAGFVYSEIFDAHDVNRDEQAVDNEYLKCITMPNGNTVPLPTPPCSFEGEGRLPWKHAPHVGEDTSRILSGLGYSDEEIRDLSKKGIIFCGSSNQ